MFRAVKIQRQRQDIQVGSNTSIGSEAKAADIKLERAAASRQVKLGAAYLGWVVANLLDVVANLLDNLIITLLAVLGLSGVHLVQTDNHLLDTQGVCQQSVLPGLAVLRDTSLETTRGGVDNEHGTVGLGGTGDHVLDKVTVTWGVDDCAVVLWCLELPQSNVDGDTTFTLSLELIQHLQNVVTTVSRPVNTTRVTMQQAPPEADNSTTRSLVSQILSQPEERT